MPLWAIQYGPINATLTKKSLVKIGVVVWLSIGIGCPWSWWSRHPWTCSRTM